jgi:hypothetical protein
MVGEERVGAAGYGLEAEVASFGNMIAFAAKFRAQTTLLR